MRLLLSHKLINLANEWLTPVNQWGGRREPDRPEEKIKKSELKSFFERQTTKNT